VRRVLAIEIEARDYADVIDLSERLGIERHRIVAQILTDWLDANVGGRVPMATRPPHRSRHHHENATQPEPIAEVTP